MTFGKKTYLFSQKPNIYVGLYTWTYPHWDIYTGSMTHGISLTNVIAPVIWYSTLTSRICSQGMGMFSRSLRTACGMYFRALDMKKQIKNITMHALKKWRQELPTIMNGDIHWWKLLPKRKNVTTFRPLNLFLITAAHRS